MSNFKEYKGFCIGNNNEKVSCIYCDTYSDFFEDIYNKLNENSDILYIPFDMDIQIGCRISFKRNSKKISKKSYNYIINNEKLKDFIWYVYQKIIFCFIYNDTLTDNEFNEFSKILKENDNIENLIIYNNTVSFPVC